MKLNNEKLGICFDLKFHIISYSLMSHLVGTFFVINRTITCLCAFAVKLVILYIHIDWRV